jgi:phosphoribosylformylglycinamidine cyclo-ligase
MPAPSQGPLSYREAGVDIDLANRFVERLKPIAARTARPGVIGGIGGFGALFEVPFERYRHPVLVSSTDGVGTKLKLAIDAGIHDTIGIDLVAMCANDVLACGAEPLYFLDYFATGRLRMELACQVMKGIGQGCQLAGIALIGGETAEMPDMYAGDDYDLAGFCVGMIEKERILDGSSVEAGDILVGIASSGPHANGYSLIRRILARTGTNLAQPLGDRSLAEILLAPTRIYVPAVQRLLAEVPVRAIAHITGGGFIENVPRVLPAHLRARIDPCAWTWPTIFHWLRTRGELREEEMYRTFNCGVGMVLCLHPSRVPEALEVLKTCGEEAWPIGVIEPVLQAQPRVIIAGTLPP